MGRHRRHQGYLPFGLSVQCIFYADVDNAQVKKELFCGEMVDDA